MPWSVKEKNGKFLVVKDGSGEVEGRHDSREAARKQVRALYAAENTNERGSKA